MISARRALTRSEQNNRTAHTFLAWTVPSTITIIIISLSLHSTVRGTEWSNWHCKDTAVFAYILQKTLDFSPSSCDNPSILRHFQGAPPKSVANNIHFLGKSFQRVETKLLTIKYKTTLPGVGMMSKHHAWKRRYRMGGVLPYSSSSHTPLWLLSTRWTFRFFI